MAATPRRGRRARSARAILAWTFVSVLALNASIHAYLEHRHPEVYDPEFGARLTVLNDRIAEAPENPLLLVVGSSRLVTDFMPERLSPLQDPTGAVLAFNFSHTGAGPLVNLMEVRRLLRKGVRPRWLVVEVLPPMLATSGRSTAASLAAADDLPLLCRHMASWKAYGRYLSARLVPNPRHYLAVVHNDGPTSQELSGLGPLGGSTPLKTPATAENIRSYTDAVRNQYRPGLQNFHVTDVADNSLREMIELCRRENVEVVLVLTPESSEFRGWYADATRKHVNDYCDNLRHHCGVRIIDARTWLPDEDFLDAHHALPRGAETFTQRLGRDVLEPLIRGELRP